ncbi:hypothetical protein AHAS_Ahas05G0043400 [Arachis hypogaea]
MVQQVTYSIMAECILCTPAHRSGCQVCAWAHYVGLSRENVRENPEETEEVVQDSMQEEDVMKDDNSKEVVSTVNNVPMLTIDLNKTPEESGVF